MGQKKEKSRNEELKRDFLLINAQFEGVIQGEETSNGTGEVSEENYQDSHNTKSPSCENDEENVEKGRRYLSQKGKGQDIQDTKAVLI